MYHAGLGARGSRSARGSGRASDCVVCDRLSPSAEPPSRDWFSAILWHVDSSTLPVPRRARARPPARASADITAFLGTNPTPVNRVTTGFGVGVGLVIVGFEFEYGHTRENLEELAPSLRTYMFNGLLQTPIPIAGMQFYGTAGAGVYRESFDEISETNVGINVGGGVKV